MAEHQSASLYLDDDSFDYEKALSEDDSSDLLHKFLTDEEWRSTEVNHPLAVAKKDKAPEEPGLIIMPTISSYMDLDSEYETDLSTLAKENLPQKVDASSESQLDTTAQVPLYHLDNNDNIILDLDDDDEDLPYEFTPKEPPDEEQQEPFNPNPQIQSLVPSQPDPSLLEEPEVSSQLAPSLLEEPEVPSQPVPNLLEEPENSKDAVGATHLEQFEAKEQQLKANQKEAISPSPIPNDSDTIQDYNNPYNNLELKEPPPAPNYMEPMEQTPLAPEDGFSSHSSSSSESEVNSEADSVSSEETPVPGRYDDLKYASNFGTSEDASLSKAQSASPAQQMREEPVPSGPITSIMVKRFKISGACNLSTAYLESLVAPYAGQSLTFDEIQDVVYVITKAYQCCGYPLSRAYLPEQDVTDGCVEIAIIEPRLDSIYIERCGFTRLCDAAVRKYLGCVKAGHTINKDELQYALIVLNDLPGTTSTFSLEPGEQPLTSSLVVRVSEKPLVTGSLETNNYGNRYTGIYQLGARVNVNDPFGYGDLISAQAFYTGQWLISGRLSYVAPVSSSGIKVGVSAAYTTYTLGSVFNILNATGTAGIYSVFTNIPLYLTQNLSLYGYGNFDYRQIQDKVQSVSSTTNKQMEVLKVGLSGNSADSWQGLNAFNLGATVGNLNAANVALGQDPYTFGTKGVFGKFSLTAERLQRLCDGWALYGSFAGQLATRNLDGTEQLYLGGPYAVRAYPSGEAPGDTVYLATVELRYSLMSLMSFCQSFVDEITLKGFVDAGSSLITKLNPDLANVIDKSRNIMGAGVGLDLMKNAFAVINLSWAHKIAGSDAQSNGKNSDQQFWARVEVKF